MEAITACGRNNISCKDATLYATTFPCHNCAKHIVSSGIKMVIYIEPYPKSKALEFYKDSITQDKNDKTKVIFQSFFGVGPRKYIEMFSMNFEIQSRKVRKNKNGDAIMWKEDEANLRSQMLPSSYLEREDIHAKNFTKFLLSLKE